MPAYADSENSVIHLAGVLVQCSQTIQPILVRGILEWILTAMGNSHYHCLPAVASLCSAIAGKSVESRDLLLITGFMGRFQTHLIMGNAPLWGQILEVLEICTAAVVGDPGHAEFVMKATRPSQIALVT
jgi:hypothetical protein